MGWKIHGEQVTIAKQIDTSVVLQLLHFFLFVSVARLASYSLPTK